MKNRRFAYWGCVLVLGLAAFWLARSTNALAQVDSATGNLRGTVTDPKGAVISGATVTATDAEKGVRRSTSSDNTGLYQITGLWPSVYDIGFEHPGFETFVQKSVVVNVGQTVVLDFRMKLSQGGAAAAGCACGCGGTTRPSCAYSCKGDPCAGGPLSNSRIIIGNVVENQPASFSVVGQNGGALTGFVVEFDDGQKATTDNHGMATFTPTARKVLKAAIPGVAATSAITVLTQEETNKLPSRVPRFASAGTEMSVTRAGMFDGRADNTRVAIGGTTCPVKFEAPGQAILSIPAETPLGPAQLHIEDQGKTIDQPINVVRFTLSAKQTRLARGQVTQGVAVVEGASPSLVGGVIRINNLSTGTVSLQAAGGGTDKIEKRIEPSMIQNGRIEIPLTIRARQSGGFQVVGGVYDPQALATAKCSCGCGGTPRPACAYSCGGGPCTGT